MSAFHQKGKVAVLLFAALLACLGSSRPQPARASQAAGSRFWDGTNPFDQPALTTRYYGSGDIDGDGSLSADDLSLAQGMAAGSLPLLFQADVDGNGAVDAQDISLLGEAATSGAVLPGWWSRLPGREARNLWIDRVLALDRTDLHPPDWWYQCLDFAQQFSLRAANYRDDLSATVYEGGQTTYNLPVYLVGVGSATYGHSINAILVGDDPLSFADWRFIEPQTDEDVHPGMWDMPYGTTVTIHVASFLVNHAYSSQPLLAFTIGDQGEVALGPYDPALLLERPAPPGLPPDNRLDAWQPTILPGAPGKILYAGQRQDLLHVSDIFLADLPFSGPSTGQPLMLAGPEYSRLLDAFADADGKVHLLWTAQVDYVPGIFYSQLDPATLAVTNTARLSSGVREPLMGRILVTSLGVIHAFWFEQHSNISSPYDAGVYWTRRSGSTWQAAQNLTPQIPGYVMRMVFSPLDHEAITYLFDTAISAGGEIVMAYTTTLSGSFPNDNPVYLRRFSGGVWRAANPVGSPPVKAYGLDLSYDRQGLLHLFYWVGDDNVRPKGFRGSLYQIANAGLGWSQPLPLDPSGLAGYPRSAVDGDGRLYLVWERIVGDQVLPVWSQYVQGTWDTPQLLAVRTNADAWYPTVTIMPAYRILFAWSARSADDVTIETALTAPYLTQKYFLPTIIRK
jgi:hypothetical protein